MDTIGDRIKQRLTELDLSFEQAGLRIGVTWQAVQQWANGKTIPRRGKEQAIADALECSRDWIFSPHRAAIDKPPPPANCLAINESVQSYGQSKWPFTTVAYQRFVNLEAKDKAFVEGVLRDAIVRCEDNGSSKRKSQATR
jgi:transcriptional regulator with XRE-family HTH domain